MNLEKVAQILFLALVDLTKVDKQELDLIQVKLRKTSRIFLRNHQIILNSSLRISNRKWEIKHKIKVLRYFFKILFE